jgi:hypothetical protein
MSKKLILFISVFLLFQLSNQKLEEDLTPLEINIICQNSYFIFGKDEGAFTFETDYTDDSNIFDQNKIEEATKFQTTISIYKENADNEYNVTCRLWKADNNINLICKYTGEIQSENYILNRANFIYDKYDIKIGSKCQKFEIERKDFNFPFLYSGKQTINNNNEQDSFELKFNIESYHNENLFLFPGGNWEEAFYLEKCEIKDKQLICQITKNKIIQFIYEEEVSAYLASMFKDYNTFFSFSGVNQITIKNSIAAKKDIDVQITKLLKKNTEKGAFIAYETNVTDILEIITNKFQLSSSGLDTECLFKKSENNPLILLCDIKNEMEGEKFLGEINETIELKETHNLYNFFILPVNNSEIFKISNEEGGYMMFSHPQTFDFTSHSSIDLFLVGERSKNIAEISLNLEKSSLSCVDNDFFKTCNVPKSHFDGKKSGNYYFYYKNKVGEMEKMYELFPAKVILPDDKDNQNSCGRNKISTILMALIIILSI